MAVPYAPGWVEYSARNGDKHVERAIRLTDHHAIQLALACSDPDVCLDIFGDAHEFTPGSEHARIAEWSFYLHDLYRLGLDITVRYVTDVEMQTRNKSAGLRLCPGCNRVFAMLHICERCGRCDDRDLPRDADREAPCCTGGAACKPRDWRAGNTPLTERNRT